MVLHPLSHLARAKLGLLALAPPSSQGQGANAETNLLEHSQCLAARSPGTNMGTQRCHVRQGSFGWSSDQGQKDLVSRPPHPLPHHHRVPSWPFSGRCPCISPCFLSQSTDNILRRSGRQSPTCTERELRESSLQWPVTVPGPFLAMWPQASLWPLQPRGPVTPARRRE